MDTAQEHPAVICPKCGFQQADTFECHRCGVIFHKYRHKVEQNNGAKDSHSRSQPDSQQSPGHGLFKGRLLLRCVLLAMLVSLFHLWYSHLPIKHGAGIIAPHQPHQVNVRPMPAFRHQDYVLTPLALFAIEARVLGVSRYRFDRAADLSPYDVALGWGPMSDEAVLDALTITQSNRFYYWSAQRLPPIPVGAIIVNSANMHLIPANRHVAKQLRRVREGHVVSIQGFLVQADAGNWHWVSSLSRDDSGAGACELIWVQELTVR